LIIENHIEDTLNLKISLILKSLITSGHPNEKV